MSFVGDIERLLAALYPLRVPIAIGTAAVLILVTYAAYRRGWHHVAARHPRATASIVAVVLAVGLPIGWVLGSPLFIRTELHEELPVATGSPAPGGAASGGEGAAGTIVLRGEFSGADEFHTGSGLALVIENAPGGHVVRLQDFSVRNGPDLYVYLSPDPAGYAAGSLELGRLKASDGSFNYEVPAGTDVTAYRSVVIWCRAFSVLFATAPLRTG